MRAVFLLLDLILVLENGYARFGRASYGYGRVQYGSSKSRGRRDDEPPFFRPPIGYGGYNPGSYYDQHPHEIYYTRTDRLSEPEGSPYLAWVIIVCILVAIFLGVLIYYLAFCYPVICKKRRHVNLEMKRHIELEEKPADV